MNLRLTAREYRHTHIYAAEIGARAIAGHLERQALGAAAGTLPRARFVMATRQTQHESDLMNEPAAQLKPVAHNILEYCFNCVVYDV